MMRPRLACSPIRLALCAATSVSLCAVLAFGLSVAPSAQTIQLPSEPQLTFGGSITGSFEGWFDNPDGSHSFLVGYFSRNTQQAVDIPIGPNNRIEPGGPDMGQPTHFLPQRNVGLFTITVPKDFKPDQRLVWTLTANGQTTSIPLRLNPDYNISPLGVDDTVGNRPPVIRFAAEAPTLTGPVGSLKTALTQTTSVGTPLPLTLWVDDDAKFTSGTNAPMRNPPPPVAIYWTKYRGPGAVTFSNTPAKLDVMKGGQVAQPFAGSGTTTATFSQPGDYVLHAMVTDYSGFGGGGEACCWTTALVRVTVK